MKNYKELVVWQKAMDLATVVYRLCAHFPAIEQYGIASQVRRGSVSVAANIAEGWGRGVTREYIQFLRIARGSLTELETHLILSHRLGYCRKQDLDKMQQEIAEIGRMLNGLIQSLKKFTVKLKRPSS
jgi:four helix bundle protein